MADENKVESKNNNGIGWIVAAILGGAALVATVIFLTLGHYRAQDEAAATSSFRTATSSQLAAIAKDAGATKVDTTAILAGQAGDRTLAAGDRTLATVRHDALRTGQDTILDSTKLISDAQDVQGQKIDDLVKKSDAAKVVSAEIQADLAKAVRDREALRRQLRANRQALEAAKGTPYRYRSETTVRYVRAR